MALDMTRAEESAVAQERCYEPSKGRSEPERARVSQRKSERARENLCGSLSGSLWVTLAISGSLSGPWEGDYKREASPTSHL